MDIVKQLTDKELIANVYFTQILIVLAATIFGVILFKDWAQFRGIFHWDLSQILMIGGGGAIIIVSIELVLEKVLPSNSFDDGGINERIFKGKSISQLFCLSVVVAVAEELFFRGVIQTHFGLVPASVLFAVLHIRYLNKITLLLLTVMISFFFGWIFMITQNLLVTIMMHVLVDFLLGLNLNFRSGKSKI